LTVGNISITGSFNPISYTVSGNVTGGNIIATGNMFSLGNVTANGVVSGNSIITVGNLNSGNVIVSGNIRGFYGFLQNNTPYATVPMKIVYGNITQSTGGALIAGTKSITSNFGYTFSDTPTVLFRTVVQGTNSLDTSAGLVTANTTSYTCAITSRLAVTAYSLNFIAIGPA